MPLMSPSPTPPTSDWPMHDQQVLPTPEQSDPPPLPVLMHPTPSPVRRSSRSNKGVTRKYDDYETGQEFDAMCTHSLRGHPYQRHFSAMSAPCQRPAPVAYPTVALSGYDVPCPTYDQLNHIHGAQTDHRHTLNEAPSPYHDHQLNQIYSGPATPYYTPITPPFKVFSPEQNKVFVFDGSMWNEFDLENVFP